MPQRFFNNLQVEIHQTPDQRAECRRALGWNRFLPYASRDLIVVLKSMSLQGDEPILIMRKDKVLGTLTTKFSKEFRDQYFFRQASLFRVPAVVSMKKPSEHEDPQIDLELYMCFLEGIDAVPDRWFNENPIEPSLFAKIRDDLAIVIACLLIAIDMILILEYFLPFPGS